MILSTLFFMIISGVILAGVALPAGNQIKSARDFFRAKQSIEASDALNDDALYRLNHSWSLPSTFSLPYSSGVSAQAVVTDTSTSTRLTVTGTSGTSIRTSRGVFSQDTGTSFSYGLQIGNGGISMSGSSRINGSVYSNGTIQGCSSCVITGSATAANVSSLTAEVQNTAASETNSITFANATASQDLSQGFTVSTSSPITRIRFYLKKVGNPSNATVSINSNSGSSPSNTILAQGTLSASLIGNTYGYVEVILNSSVVLSSGTQYWLVIDASSNSTNYYVAGALNNTYSGGVAKIGRVGSTWNSTSPSTLDIFFQVYTGGIYGKILGENQNNRLTVGTSASGTAYANTVNYVSIADKTYCSSSQYVYKQSGGAAVSCDTSRGDPPQLAFPVSDSNISDWKDVVNTEIENISGGYTYSGNITINSSGTTTSTLRQINGDLTLSCSSNPANFSDLYVTGNLSISSSCNYSFGTLRVGGNMTVGGSATGNVETFKVEGNLSVTNSGRLYIKGPGYIVGNTTVSGSASLKLHSSYTSSDGYIISDGIVSISGSGAADGSGTSGSYIVFITTSQCPYSGSCSSSPAITLNGSAGAIVLVGPYGDVSVTGSAQAKSVVGYKIIMTGSAVVNYDSGLTNIDFVSGPSGSWKVNSWKEVAN